MNQKIETFLTYLLDTETTSEVTFFETICKHDELFEADYLNNWKSAICYQLLLIHQNSSVKFNNTGLTFNEENFKTNDDSSSDDHDEDLGNMRKKNVRFKSVLFCLK